MSIVSRQAFIAITLISRMPLSPSGLRQVSPIWSDLNISRNKHPRTLSNFGSSSLRTLGSRRGVPGQKQPSALPIEVSSTMETRTAILVYGAAVDIGIQLVGWALATVLRTETFYDAFGSLSYCALAIGSLAYGGNEHPRQILMTTLVCVWTLRLGTFLLLRALRTGGDSRFDELKHQTCRSFLLTHSSTLPEFQLTIWFLLTGLNRMCTVKFLVAWILQAVWAWVVSLPLLLLNGYPGPGPGISWTDVIGVFLWAMGFIIETVADLQKSAFKMDAANRGKFIDRGLWAWARYPNYFGEMMLWWGAFLGCSAVFQGADWAAVVSPLFVAFLLLFVSGVPLQERQAMARWGEDPEYRAYRERTFLLLPLPLKKIWATGKHT